MCLHSNILKFPSNPMTAKKPLGKKSCNVHSITKWLFFYFERTFKNYFSDWLLSANVLVLTELRLAHTNQYMRRQVLCDDSNSIHRVTAKCLGSNDYISASLPAHEDLSVKHFAFVDFQNNAYFLQNTHFAHYINFFQSQD